MENLNHLLSQKEIFFNFMKEKYPVHYNSNIFLRDLQYAIRSYFEKKNVQLKYPEAEETALLFTQKLEESGDLKRVQKNAWKVNFSLNKDVINSGQAN